MNPVAQTSKYQYLLELQRDQTCPVDINNGFETDPRYTQLNASLWQTNEYLVQQESQVLYMLEAQPSFFTYVPNPSLKKQVVLTAWTRAQMSWNIECEWDGSMSRTQANAYYKQAFGDPSSTEAAEIASLCMWGIAVFVLVVTVACPIFT